jgi:hypothetical protein
MDPVFLEVKLPTQISQDVILEWLLQEYLVHVLDQLGVASHSVHVVEPAESKIKQILI